MKTKEITTHSRKEFGKKAKRIYMLAVTMFIMVNVLLCMTTVACAAQTNEAIQALNNFNGLLILVVKCIGGAMALFGLVQAVTSISSHDASQRVQGLLFLGGGVLIFFAKEILAYIGITL